jgi:GNAT superfamily N-acetyltransferase
MRLALVELPCHSVRQSMVRLATDEDVARIAELGVRFNQETPYQQILTVDPALLETLTRSLLANEDALALVSEIDGDVVGVLGMLVTSHPYSGERVASEIVWWVNPNQRGDGVKMLLYAERWAREKGAVVIQMIAPDRRLEQFYERVDYVPVERAYQKRIA